MGDNLPDSSFEPKGFHNLGHRQMAGATPMIVFYYSTTHLIVVKKESEDIKVEEGEEEYEVQQVRHVDKQWLPLGLVKDNFNAPVTIAIDDAEENEGQRINFRTLVGAGPNENVDFLWIAFTELVSWIYSGKYVADQSHTSHVNACIIAEILKAPRFMNRAMVEAVHSMKTREQNLKANVNILRENYRKIFALCPDTSPIYRLYFEASIYWKLAFGRYAYPEEIHLRLDPIADAALRNTQMQYKLEFCSCNFAQIDEELMYGKHADNFEDLPTVPAADPNCRCQQKPWNTWPRFFFEVKG